MSGFHLNRNNASQSIRAAITRNANAVANAPGGSVIVIVDILYKRWHSPLGNCSFAAGWQPGIIGEKGKSYCSYTNLDCFVCQMVTSFLEPMPGQA